MTRTYWYTGVLLFIGYLLQALIPLRWKYLYDLQMDESYKRWSGLVLLIFISLQWSLTIFRIRKKWEKKAFKVMQVHRWMGTVSPLIFYVHSMKLGFAYLFVLSITFFTNLLLGFVYTDVIKTRAYWYFQGWMIMHVVLSMLITVLALYHIWIVFTYH